MALHVHTEYDNLVHVLQVMNLRNQFVANTSCSDENGSDIRIDLSDTFVYVIAEGEAGELLLESLTVNFCLFLVDVSIEPDDTSTIQRTFREEVLMRNLDHFNNHRLGLLRILRNVEHLVTEIRQE